MQGNSDNQVISGRIWPVIGWIIQMDNENLERVIDEKIKPMLDWTMHRFLGVTINEIRADISDRLKKSSMPDLIIDSELPFRKAKKQFRRFYLIRLLQNNFGNISAVARIAGIDRRSIHRLAAELKINVRKMREEMLRADYLRQAAVQGIIETTLETYKGAIAPEKFRQMYQNAQTLSKDIIKELPESPLDLNSAEEEFEKRYFLQALTQNKFSISSTARQAGLRYETLHRKLKQLDIAPASLKKPAADRKI